ncbi:MAG: hypothetical protein C4535_03960 [Comamonadaceae bacterium]|nr:MAG: hypothetical protein C4535_03960 [Comamonadaceae bacterium]
MDVAYTARDTASRIVTREDRRHRSHEDTILDPRAAVRVVHDYEMLVTDSFRSLGLAHDQAQVRVRFVGLSPSGLQVYAAFVRIVRWDQVVVDLLAQMPAVERALARLIMEGSLLRHTRFAGLWFRSQLNATVPVASGAPEAH